MMILLLQIVIVLQTITFLTSFLQNSKIEMPIRPYITLCEFCKTLRTMIFTFQYLCSPLAHYYASFQFGLHSFVSSCIQRREKHRQGDKRREVTCLDPRVFPLVRRLPFGLVFLALMITETLIDGRSQLPALVFHCCRCHPRTRQDAALNIFLDMKLITRDVPHYLLVVKASETLRTKY